MIWYYMKKGSVRTRSILSYDQLVMMARAGEIHEQDLLWSDKTEKKWVRASSIEELFKVDKEGPAPQSEAVPAEPQAVAAEPSAPEKEKNPKKAAAAAVIIAILAIITVLSVGKVKEMLTPPPPPPPPPVETNTWETVDADLAALIKNGHLNDARQMIADYVEDKGNDETSAQLKRRLDQHLKRTKLSTLYVTFIRGRTTAAQAKELVQLSTELAEMDKLKASLVAALKTAKQPATCRNILNLAKLMKDRPLQLQAVESLSRVVDAGASEKNCMELVELYLHYDMQKEALSILKSFTADHQEAATAWLELSALLALQNDEDESLNALKVAVKAGGDATKEKARNDPRFDSIKDTWSFKRKTK